MFTGRSPGFLGTSLLFHQAVTRPSPGALTGPQAARHHRPVADPAPSDTPADGALPDYVRGLLDPSPYPHRPREVDLVQTHLSYVFLAGDVVYKTKKPVDFGFIVQVEPEQRERFCHDEVRLNRRLAPDVYLDVVPVTRTADGRFAVEAEDAAAPVVEWAVKMRRLPDDRTLDRLLAAGEQPPRLIEHIVRRLIAFHEAAEVVGNDREFAGGPAEAAWWRREYAEAEGFIGDTWRPDDARATRAFIERTIEEQQALFDERLAAGRVIEGRLLGIVGVFIIVGGDKFRDGKAFFIGLLPGGRFHFFQ